MPKIAEIEDTPNPNAVKFLLKERLSWGAAKNYSSPGEAEEDDLAQKLFAIPHVCGVFYMDNWITVTQDGAADWPDLVRKVAQPIREAQAAVRPASMETKNGEDTPRLAAIRALLDAQIRPALMGDGGDLEIVSLEGNILCIRYYGACGSCPSSLAGTLHAIGSLVRTIEPEIEVIAV
ncbi:MAG: NifU family protein [Burkholderiales bacterium]|nr:NifU family protein [Burkholderiales bacterium]